MQSSSAPHSAAAVLRGVGDLGGHGVDRVGVDAVGEQPAVAIEDLAALGGRRHGAHLLPLGARDQLVVLNDLQEDEPRLDAERPQDRARPPPR